MSAKVADPLPYPAVIKLASFLTFEDGAFIVGGQALNLWAERYYAAYPTLAAFAPYTSKDIDYFGYQAAAKKLAKALGGKVVFPEIGDASPNSALVVAKIEGREVEIDFIDHVMGVMPRDLERDALELRVPLKDAEGYIDIPVMHPLHCLQSRIANCQRLGRSDDVALRQLKAAPVVLDAFIDEMLAEGHLKEVNLTLRGLFHYLKTDPDAQAIQDLAIQDPLLSIVRLTSDKRLDWRYRWFNIRAMKWKIRRKRAQRAVRTRLSKVADAT